MRKIRAFFILVETTLFNNRKAIKIMRLMDDDDDANVDNKYIKRLMDEAKLMSKLDHPNILKFDECFQYNIYFCIVSECCDVFKFQMNILILKFSF